MSISVNFWTLHTPKIWKTAFIFILAQFFVHGFACIVALKLFSAKRKKSTKKNLDNILPRWQSVGFVFEKNFVSMLHATFLLLQRHSKSGLLPVFCVNYSECENFMTSFKKKESLFDKGEKVKRFYSRPDRRGFDLHFLLGLARSF